MKIEFCVDGKKVVVESAGAVSVQVLEVTEAQAMEKAEAQGPAGGGGDLFSRLVELRRELEEAPPYYDEPYEDAQEEEEASSGDLFLELSSLRRQIAAEQKVPAYVVFKDSTLLEMARTRPQDLEELRGISGVGAAKLEKYGKRFLAVIRAVAA